MAGINIPGVTDKYNTNDTIEKLMKVERIPLTREEKQLETLKTQKDAWRDINTHLTSLRDSIKTLYSYENPFNNKMTTSTDENAITAEASRGADLQSFKIDVIQPATSDRFLSGELDKDYKVPKGMYIYKVGEKKVAINWKGGSLSDFSQAINKRSNGVVKSMIIGSSQGKKSILIEAVATGKENRLIFEDDAKTFAIESDMISPIQKSDNNFGQSKSELKTTIFQEENQQQRMPKISLEKVAFENEKIKIEPRGGFEIKVPEKVSINPNNHITFEIKATNVEDITIALNEQPVNPEIQESGFAEFEGIVVKNFISDTQLPAQVPQEKLIPIQDKDILYAIMKDGSEKIIELPNESFETETKIDFSLNEYQNIDKLAIRNKNTSKIYEITPFSVYNPSEDLGFKPNNAVSEADDAIIKYEGIKMSRPSNDIDDVVPDITLHIHDKTEKTATIAVKADVEASKDALISFVGEYNQTVAKINILSQTKSDVIDELTYLTDEEKEKQYELLGMFQTDFSLTSIKSNMQSIVSTGYKFSDDAEITMLSQIGISTNASGASGGYSPSKLRGYLEIDEKKLDSALENHLDDIKNIFGFDSDGDLIIDSGIAFKLDKQISAYTQTGGILALKTANLDSKIKTSESRITRLEDQMNEKEAELRYKYGQMEGTLNSLESQQNSLSNFSKQNSNN